MKPTTLVKSSQWRATRPTLWEWAHACSAPRQTAPPLRLIYLTTSNSSDDFRRNDRWKVINGLRDACFCSRGEYLQSWLAVAALVLCRLLWIVRVDALHAGVLHNDCRSLEISHVDGNNGFPLEWKHTRTCSLCVCSSVLVRNSDDDDDEVCICRSVRLNC